MNTLSLFCFIKDEIDFVYSFIEYHKNIFDKMIIIDNGSTDGTLEILEEYHKNKTIILMKDNSPFSTKGEICSRIMKQSTCDLLVCLDADEILIFDDNNIRTKNIEQIKTYLKNIKIDGYKYKINQIYNYHPDDDGWYGISRHTKIIFPKKTFLYTDPGFHRGRTILDPESNFNSDPYYWRILFDKSKNVGDKITNINISYLHYHFKSKEIWLKNTEKKLKARLGENWNNLDFLESYSGPSIHSKNEYIKYLKTKEWIGCGKDIFLGDL